MKYSFQRVASADHSQYKLICGGLWCELDIGCDGAKNLQFGVVRWELNRSVSFFQARLGNQEQAFRLQSRDGSTT
jgi:hypothetical protein